MLNDCLSVPSCGGRTTPLSARGLMGGGGPHRMGREKGNGTLFLDEIGNPHRMGREKGAFSRPFPHMRFYSRCAHWRTVSSSMSARAAMPSTS